MKFKLPPYQWQHNAIGMADTMPDLALLADMGTGKTGALINILRKRFAEKGKIRRTLIVSPLVTLLNWRNEFDKHSYIDLAKVHVLKGTSAKKIKTFLEANQHGSDRIFIMNYEGMLSEKLSELITTWQPEILVLDESHYCKNYKAKRSKKMFALGVGADHRYIMTGTPMTNDLPDIFMQYKILDGGKTFGTNFYVFQRTYMYDANAAWSHQPNHFPKWRVRPEKVAEVQAMIYSKAIRVTKAECLDLPPFVQEIYPVQMSPKQAKYYKEMERDFVTFIDEGERKGIAVAQLAITKALRLQQIVTGFVKDDDGKIIEIADNPRLKAVDELVSSLHGKHKIILWCSFKHNYKQLGELMQKLKVDHRFITGDMTLDEKYKAMQEFNDEDSVRVIICNRKAGGIGINLVAASYSIVYSRNFSLEEELQSRDRNYRGGSEHHERITKIDLCAEGTIDEVVTESLVHKKKIADDIIEIVRNGGVR